MSKKIDIIVNVIILILITLIVGHFIQRYTFSTTRNLQNLKTPTPGKKIPLTGINWSENEKNVVIVLQKGCRFCNESAEFYKSLIQQSEGKKIKFVAVLSQPKDESEKYLNELGIPKIEVIQSRLDLLEVEATPTIIIINRSGEIIHSWRGKLSVDKQAEVVQIVDS